MSQPVYMIAHYAGPTPGLHVEWFYLASSVRGRVAQLQADDTDFTQLSEAMDDLASWLTTAKLGDTHNAGWGVSFVALVQLSEAVDVVEDHDLYHHGQVEAPARATDPTLARVVELAASVNEAGGFPTEGECLDMIRAVLEDAGL